jgi:manganese efflux pump family protein
VSTVLLLLAFALAWDSFLASLALGSLRLSLRHRLRMALAFGLCDAAALLAGFAISEPVARGVGPWASPVAPLFLGGYGLYVIVVARRCERRQTQDADDHWWLLGVPVSLSLDNLIAGLSVGLDRFPFVTSVAVIGATSALLSLAALLAGGTIRRLAPARAESLGGIWLVILSVALALDR